MAIHNIENRSGSVASTDEGADVARRFWPFEKIVCDQTLSGAMGTGRQSKRNPRGFADDFKAAAAWLHDYEENPRTHRAYLTALDTLFNWAIFARKLALSSFTTADFAQFDRYMADPTQWDPLCARSHARRGDPGWCPIRSSRSAASRQHVMSCVKSMAGWWSKVDYAELSVEVPRATGLVRSAYPTSSATRVLSVRRPCMGVSEWAVLKQSMQLWPVTTLWARMQVIVRLLYYADLTLEEAMSLNFGAIEVMLDDQRPPLILAPRRTGWRAKVYLLPVVCDAIRTWVRLENADGSPSSSLSLGTRSRCHADVVRANEAAAMQADERGWLQIAAGLRSATPRLLHRALAHHAQDSNCHHVAWQLLGTSVLTKSHFDNYFAREELNLEEYESRCTRLHDALAMQEHVALSRLEHGY